MPRPVGLPHRLRPLNIRQHTVNKLVCLASKRISTLTQIVTEVCFPIVETAHVSCVPFGQREIVSINFVKGLSHDRTKNLFALHYNKNRLMFPFFYKTVIPLASIFPTPCISRSKNMVAAVGKTRTEANNHSCIPTNTLFIFDIVLTVQI